MRIRDMTPADDAVLTRHYLALWDSYGTPREHLYPDAEDRVRAFLEEGRRERKLKAFVAEEGDVAAASAGCQLLVSPYPMVVKPKHRQHGYIFHVWVEPEFRRRGVARELVAKCMEYLKAIGCTTIVLHSSDAGEKLYEAMGFELAREMRMKV